MEIFFKLLLCYLIGSVSGSILLGKIKAINIREMGFALSVRVGPGSLTVGVQKNTLYLLLISLPESLSVTFWDLYHVE